MLSKGCLSIFWMVAHLVVPSAHADTMMVYTENYPPYNYMNENGEVVGLATENIRKVLDAAGLEYQIRLVPWTRAMYNAQTQKNALIYTITRTPKREEMFDWLVPIAKSNFYLFVRADETRSVTPETLRSGMFTASCVTGDLACDLLNWTDIGSNNIIPISKEGTGDFRMVIAGRSDIYLSDLAVNAQLRKQEGYSLDLTKPVMRLNGKTGLFLAAGTQVPENIRQNIKAAYQGLIAEGNYALVDTTPAAE
ncbi:substrate-binding periplasmic protein [Kordiimonas pumila]|uniref:Substrate-binding periplasmic protein n=1 Tax=Kordiimonas pumila TaxID=2161677 RepID=A0ABV7D6I7_9PROT|nr:transporter substrate-binding domain-containing protein [Kordiimonas pumila]